MPQYFDTDPNTPSDRKLIDYRANGINFEFITDTAVFSRKGVDFGTDLMINAIIADIKTRKHRNESFLDLGCGMGVVGIVIKNCFMGFSVTGVDVNSRAVGLAQENADRNGVPVDFKQSDVLSAVPEDQLFDMVATNPPVRAGKATVFRFYEEAYAHMKEGAYLYVVLQRKQGAPSTAAKLEELFGNCETLTIDGGYRVMRSQKTNA